MKNMCFFLFLVASTILSVPIVSAQSANGDQEGCKDYPLFSRMPNYHIVECESIQFDARKFPIGPPLKEQRPKQVGVEGSLTFLKYAVNDGFKPASGLQIMRNFENATKKAGGSVEGKYPDWCMAYVDFNRADGACTYWGVSMKFAASAKEIWAYMQMVEEDSYAIQIIEREAMKQDIVANAAALQEGLAATGHIAVYDILFDTGKSEIKPASEAVLREIASLMGQNPSLQLHVVGHTDNVGNLAANMKLSQARAAAVVAALTSKHGVPHTRLNAYGAGPYAPVASNKTDAGRAKNRRVELVEQ